MKDIVAHGTTLQVSSHWRSCDTPQHATEALPIDAALENASIQDRNTGSGFGIALALLVGAFLFMSSQAYAAAAYSVYGHAFAAAMTAKQAINFRDTGEAAPAADTGGSRLAFDAKMTLASDGGTAKEKCNGRFLHEYAWPEALEYFNSTIANKEKGIEKLNKTSFLAPSFMGMRDDICLLTYGGNKAGVVILLEMTSSGEILNIHASYAAK